MIESTLTTPNGQYKLNSFLNKFPGTNQLETEKKNRVNKEPSSKTILVKRPTLKTRSSMHTPTIALETSTSL